MKVLIFFLQIMEFDQLEESALYISIFIPQQAVIYE